MTALVYGNPPTEVQSFTPDWTEYMHYLYLPVVMPGQPGVRLPPNLEFLRDPVVAAMRAEGVVLEAPRSGFSGAHRRHGYVGSCFVYVTARRGFAAPGNPLNRPGWHADGFGTDDINYIWSDPWPTRFAIGTFSDISEDHVESAEQFEAQVAAAEAHGMGADIEVHDGKPRMLYRLDPSVIHATPIIPAPGGSRSFFKISLSPDRYNLEGNSHNYSFDYEWRMFSREEVRNDPAYAGGDAGPQPDPVR